MLARMACHFPETAPGLVISRLLLALLVGAIPALTVEIGLADPDIFRLALSRGIVTIVEMAPGNDQRVGVVHRDDPPGESRTAEVAHLADVLENSAVLRKVGHDVVVQPDPDVITDTSGVRVEEAV